MNSTDWVSLTGSPYAGVRGGFRPMREPRHVAKAATPASKRQAIAAARLRRKLALAVAQATAPRMPKPVRRYTLTTAEYALANETERARSDRVIRRFHKPY